MVDVGDAKLFVIWKRLAVAGDQSIRGEEGKYPVGDLSDTSRVL